MQQGKVTGALASFSHEDANTWLTIYCVEAAWIIAVNVISIITFLMKIKYFRQAVYMLVNLSVSDLLYGCSIAILCLYILLGSGNSQGEHSFLILPISFCITSSGTSILLVAVDRVFATFFPFRYRVVTYKYYSSVLGTNWSLCLSLAIGNYLTPSKYVHILAFFYAVIIVFSLIGIIISYTAIFVKVRSQGQLSNRNEQLAQLRDRNMVYTLIIVTLCSLLTWLPIGLVFVINQRTNIILPMEISGCAIIVQASNSFINPIIYAFRIRHFRKALFQVLCRYAKYRAHVHPVS